MSKRLIYRRKKDVKWSPEIIKKFKKDYGSYEDAVLAQMYRTTILKVDSLANEYALAKSKKKIKGTRMIHWTDSEVRKLKMQYPDISNLEIAKDLRKSVTAVLSKASNLGLKKSKRYLSSIYRKNVSDGQYKEPFSDKNT